MGAEAKQEDAKPEVKQPEEMKEVPKEESKEEPKEEKPAEEKKEEEVKPPPPFILFVDLHCVGCAKKIERSLLKIRGVEGVTIDMGQNQVTIKGIVEPEAVCNMIRKKTKRRAQVLSPLPEAEGEPIPQVVNSQATGPTTVELNINMHCEACAEQLKKKILKMRGVQTVVTELQAGKVTVTGTMDANKLVEYVYRRTKKQAKIVPQPEPEPAPEPEKPEEKKEEAGGENGEKKEEEKPAGEEEGKKEEGGGGGESNSKEKEGGGEESNQGEMGMMAAMVEDENMKRMMYYHQYQPLYVIERIPPPQLFSDENPNACSIS